MMEGGSMAIAGLNGALHLASGSMRAHAGGMGVVAHNIANVSTAGFEPLRATYVTGPGGMGARLEFVRNTGMDLAAQAGVAAMPAENRPSGTDLAREVTGMIAGQRSYEANATVVRATDEMFGTLIDIKA